MARVVIHEEEKQRIVNLVKHNSGKQLSIAQYAKMANYNANRTRFIFDELLEESRIKKTVVKQYNEKYIRHSYSV